MNEHIMSDKSIKGMIGILDPNGENNNPLTEQPYSETYKNLGKIWSKFPAYDDPKKIH